MTDPQGTATKTRRGGITPPQHRGRVLALQVLFECDLTNHEWHDSIGDQSDAIRASATATAFAQTCIAGVLECRDEWDREIRRHAPLWPVEQLSTVDRNVLRMAFYELRVGSRVPPRVVINEAVELAKEFGGEHSAQFVNGVLGAAVDERLG